MIDFSRVLLNADLGYGAVWLLPYNYQKDLTVAHPEAHTWYDNLLVARRIIP